MMQGILQCTGFGNEYDFLYLPIDFEKKANLGYAFVNFANHEHALQAKHVFSGFKKWGIGTNKICYAGWSKPLQGLSANIRRYRDSPVMAADVPEQYKPILVSKGQRQPFPKPTQKKTVA